LKKFQSFTFEACCYSLPPAGSQVRTFAALVDVVASGQIRQTLACRLLVPGADSAVETTVAGLVAFVTYLLVTTLDCGCTNIKKFV
jgi:hypothetical protein